MTNLFSLLLGFVALLAFLSVLVLALAVVIRDVIRYWGIGNTESSAWLSDE